MTTLAKQIGRAHANTESSTRAHEFVTLARAIALSKGDQGAARDIADQARLSPAVKRLLVGAKIYDLRPEIVRNQRAVAAAGTTSDASWALPLAEYQTLADAFLESLRNFGAFDRMLPSMRRVPLRTRVGASTVGVTGTTVGQQQVKSISNLSLTDGTISEFKAIAILVLTRELASPT